MDYFWHSVNGGLYNTRGMLNPPKTLEEYKVILRRAYGSLKGVKVWAA